MLCVQSKGSELFLLTEFHPVQSFSNILLLLYCMPQPVGTSILCPIHATITLCCTAYDHFAPVMLHLFHTHDALLGHTQA